MNDQSVEFTFQGETWVLDYRDSDHSYRLGPYGQQRVRALGVSTIAKVSYSDPSGLMNYAYKHGVAGTDYKEATKFTQECGTAAHDQLEALAKYEVLLDLSDQPERVRGALQGVAGWWLEHRPQFVESEVLVCSPLLCYAGRFDFLAEVDGELVLADLKTTDKSWEHFERYKAPAAYAQLAGYSLAYGVMFPDKPQPTGRYILHVSTNGSYDWKRDLAPEFSEASFLSKLETYRSQSAWEKACREAMRVAA